MQKYLKYAWMLAGILCAACTLAGAWHHIITTAACAIMYTVCASGGDDDEEK